MDRDGTYTSLRMGPDQFFDMLDHISNLVTNQSFAFQVAVPEALSFTITNEVMDIDGDYAHLKPFFKRDGNFVDRDAEGRFVEEVRALVLDPAVMATWTAANPMWVTPEQVRDVLASAGA